MAAKQNNEVTSGSEGKAGVFERFRDYLTEARAELKKVTWPTKKEARVTSIAVLVLVAVMSIFLGLVDLGMMKIVNVILTAGV